MAKFDNIAPAANSKAMTLTWPGAHLAQLSREIATETKGGIYRNGFKRVLDITLVLVAMPFVLPLIALCTLLVMLDGGSPFYSQERVGRGGRIFRMWKLRSMVVDADARLKDVLATDPALRQEWHHSQKLRCDPRITRIGRILRKTSLDELPQLFNVLTGEMSLVGPRPMLPEQQTLYSGDSYYRLRPGLTGLWQVSQRNKTSFADRAGFDTTYDKGLSLMGDLRLMVATVAVIARGTGC